MPALRLDILLRIIMNKEIRKEVRITKSDLSIILRKANLLNMNFSEYVRHVGTRSRLFTVMPIINDNMLSELSRVGNNLNQIAKALNGPNKDLYILNEHDSIIKDFKNTEKVFNLILDAHKSYLSNPEKHKILIDDSKN